MSADIPTSPAALRNREAIGERLLTLLPDGARVLEIASGGGEHAVYFKGQRPDLHWQGSDLSPRAREIYVARAKANGVQLPAPLALDMVARRWTDLVAAPVNCLYCANMIHIAPWAAAEGLVAGAADILGPNGFGCLYGPFKFGADTAPSNLMFDESLKSRDASWGVREYADVEALLSRRGFKVTDLLTCPANNHLIMFRRSERE